MKVPHDCFVEPQEFWCDRCDEKIVNSDDPKTGEFFARSGHVVSITGKNGLSVLTGH